MERRKFVLLSLVGTAAVSLPLSYCGKGNNTGLPEFLHLLVGKSKIKEIGKTYVERFPSEADSKKLTALISAALHEQSGSADNLRIQNEFQSGKIVIISGWILSLTEARQSALFYLNSSS